MSTLAASTEKELSLLGQQAARELRSAWRRGSRRRAEDVLDQYPTLRQRAECSVDVIYEEYLLRLADGDNEAEHDLLRRFPQWHEPLRLMIDCHRLLQPTGTPVYPQVGEWLGEFHLLDELGRGGRGRVYLATQADLAGRLVVLKLTPFDGIEHLSLARLQHTNIVPAYSVAEDPSRQLRILVMPYFGPMTLASLLAALAEIPIAQRQGQHLVAALDLAHDPRLPAPSATAARQMLTHVSYTQAVCWIGACLADALQYAHDRDLVHLDVKPSNVLLPADGQPMLLDFHLACAPLHRDSVAPDKFGGTLEYMPPEQRQAMLSLKSEGTVVADVDARADVFALGAILYELFGGRLPLTSESPPLHAIHPQIGCGLSDIVAKCLSSQPQQRYDSAAELAADLRRHLADQPLVGVRNRSVAERWRKWRRRQPGTLRRFTLIAVVLLASTLGAFTYWQQRQQRRQDVTQALLDSQTSLRSGRPQEAVRLLERERSRGQALSIPGDLDGALRNQLAVARRQRAVLELQELANRVRVLFGSDLRTLADQPSLANLCRDFWGQRHALAAQLEANRDAEVAANFLDVAIFWAKLQRSDESAAELGPESTLRTLAEADELFGPSRVLDLERTLLRGEPLPLDGPFTSKGDRSDSCDTAREHYALGRALLDAGRATDALAELDAARALDPAGLWPNFYWGLCAQRLGRHQDAITAFSLCIGAAPNSAACFRNRGLSFQALGDADAADRDFAYARQLD